MFRNALRVFVFTILAVYGLFFFEWLFFITKPSILSNKSIYQNLVTLAIAPLPMVVIACLAVAILHFLLGVRFIQRRWSLFPLVIAALIIACLLLLLIDNFTYTLFSISISKFPNFWRFGYLLLFVVVAGWIFKVMHDLIQKQNYSWFWKTATVSAFTLLLFSLTFLVTKENPTEHISFGKGAKRSSGYPNIVIFSTDGLDANRMSVYGYERETTPFLQKLAEETVLFENSFANAAHTTGSLTSMLTGKLPTETRVLYPPDVLTGKNMYQHLPFILHQLGYYNIEITLRFYADAIDLNMHDSFDFANFRYIKNPLRIPQSIRLTYTSEISFFERVVDRVLSRMLHILNIKDMINYYALVTDTPKSRGFSDSARMYSLQEIIKKSPQPFFVNVHLIETHGPKFHVSRKNKHFSRGMKQDRSWSKDFGDDAIRQFDIRVKNIVEFLKDNKLYDNTLLVITSDHGSRWRNRERVPLLIKLPHAAKTGRVKENVQRLDLAPTLLNTLGVAVPEWMTGAKIFEANDELRPILSAKIKRAKKKDKHNRLIQGDMKPPFYSLGFVDLIRCHRWVSLNLTTGVGLSGYVDGHTSPCSEDRLPSIEEEREYIINHLRGNQYDVSTLVNE